MLHTKTPYRAIISAVALLIRASWAECYRPDGSKQTNLAYQPCNQIAGQFSMCCGTNHSSSSTIVANDICEPNGLCQNWITYSDGKSIKTRWRESCSDPTWQSPNCLKGICFDDLDTNGNRAMSSCPDGSWCCGADEGSSCCNDEQARFFLAATVGQSATSSTSTTQTLSSSSTSTGMTENPKATPTQTPQPTQDSGLGGGKIAGIVIGSIIGLAIIIGAVYWWLTKKRSAKYEISPTELDDTNRKYIGGRVDQYQLSHELPGQHVTYHEADGNSRRAELGSS